MTPAARAQGMQGAGPWCSPQAGSCRGPRCLVRMSAVTRSCCQHTGARGWLQTPHQEHFSTDREVLLLTPLRGNRLQQQPQRQRWCGAGTFTRALLAALGCWAVPSPRCWSWGHRDTSVGPALGGAGSPAGPELWQWGRSRQQCVGCQQLPRCSLLLRQARQ